MSREEKSGKKSSLGGRERKLKDEKVDNTSEERIHRVQRARWEEGGRREGEYRRGQAGGRETRHTGLVRSRLWRLGVGLVSEGPRVQTDRGREKRKQRSILSELGSYPRGHRTGLARERVREEGGEWGAVGWVESNGAIYIILFWT